MWYVYILECENTYLYTGATNDLGRRVKEHLTGKGGKFTHAFKAQKLLFSEKANNKGEALQREAQIKGWTRIEKLALIEGDK
ncbi:MAG: GIY-YIG nuclease family protein [Candidatus Omnitrophica bacterium]|nr:GIY-YIG nuclease family protein [Candidatus Omnitrophota bacterium]